MNIYILLALLVPTLDAIALTDIQRLLPGCALQCLAEQVLAHGCALDELVCHCRRIEPIIQGLAPCLVKAGCNLQELTATGKAIYEVCSAVSDNTTVTLAAPTTIPTAAAGKTASRAVWMGVGVGLAMAAWW
ncbi:hypothetical protein E4U42_007688 [Claviceps africana]|uniref:CFEM domain-containing protein n=1 Tax=Claviceps africana TaxID=83212 RepID=A0A8K0J0U5_9HYPO|nr:hypothetical protein E4U42_007688 [Claviceps africana]